MKKTIYTILVVAVAFTACKKEASHSHAGITPAVPATYNFDNMNYSGQLDRIAMLDEMLTYIKSGSTGVTLDASHIKNMFSNTGAPFANASLNTSGKQLKNKCFALDQAMFEAYMDSVAQASMSGTPGSNGVAGVVVSSSDPSKKYLCGANGVEYAQVIEKGLMGAVFYYQACETYLSESGIGMSVDNTVVVPGEGTAMEHHWDEAFGYFTAPVDFPQNTSGLKYWAKYSNTVNPHINSNTPIMDAFKKGRVAIGANNHSLKNQCVTTIKTNWDKVVAATVIHYINESLSNFSNDAVRNHSLSEGLGFVISLKYNSERAISMSDINQVMSLIGGNFYNVTVSNLNQAKTIMSDAYNLGSVKDVL